ncbi:hypothetical protein [Allosphingosinicella sp.]|uniref:hypothetical protein n=1 Tax=Allosphingosinicella sp. TaxID=2823234 RepID=UPI002F1A6C60
MKPWPLLIASTLLAGAPPPPNAQTKEDVHCLLAAASLTESKDEKIKQVGAAGALYYLGRLDGRTPDLDIEAVVAAEADAVARAEQGPLLKKCGDTLQRRGDYLVSAGKALEKRGK